MDMVNVSPESVGIKSENIIKYINILEKNNLATHDVIIARGDNVCFSAYWAPFDRSFNHRQYSITKSIVALAVGFTLDDGLLDIDKALVEYFPEEAKNVTDEYFLQMTVKQMLTMTTSFSDKNWFWTKPEDRVKFYFDKKDRPSRPAGMFFEYDSAGSFVVGALVERLTKQKLGDYLYEKLFKHLGITHDDYEFLECPGGHSWSDSALIMKPEAMLKIARFTLNYGTWDGRRLLSADYLKTATSKLVDNSTTADEQFSSLGYGYYIWRTLEDSFFFNGMGCQFAICNPKKDIILIYNGDNQGKAYAKKVIIDSFFDLIVDTAEDVPLDENISAQAELKKLTSSLKLAVAKGNTASAKSEEINKKVFVMNENPMGIKNVSFEFSGDAGILKYENAQGAKEIPFGFGKNVFFDFPQTGYSDRVGSQSGNRLYRSAASAAWLEENKLIIDIKAIDKYFGVLYMIFSFADNTVFVNMSKVAEDFFNEYQGRAIGYEK